MSTFKFVPEQQAVIDSDAQTLLIKALAGTGKSTLLRGYASARPRERVLCLVYNASARDEGRRLAPPNMKVMTAHGAAFPEYGSKYAAADKLTSDLRPYELMPAMGIDEMQHLPVQSRLLYALRLKETLENFIASPSGQVLPQHVAMDRANNIELRFFDPEGLRKHAEQAWEIMCDLRNPSIGMTHDGYLKLFLLGGARLGRYDRVMLDEAQDSNPVTLEIVRCQQAGQIYVGDTNQQLYRYRGAVDAMSRVVADKSFPLRGSFRFGDEIAEVANHLLALNGSDIMVRGLGKPGQVLEGGKSLQNAVPHHISRGNSYIFEKAIEAARDGKRIGFVGGVKGYRFEMLEDVYRVMTHGKPRDPFLKSFDDFELLEQYAAEADDKDLLRSLKICKERGSQLPGLVNSIKTRAVDDAANAEIMFSTVHKAKGMEYDNVVVGDDFREFADKKGTKTLAQARAKNNEDAEWSEIIRDEINIAYVATSRAKRWLHIPEQIHRLRKLEGMDHAIAEAAHNSMASPGVSAGGDMRAAAAKRKARLG